MSLPSSHSNSSHNHHKVSHVWLALITLILFGAFVFRLWNLGLQSLWHDEAWAVYSAYDALNVYSPTVDPNAPPIFYMTLGFWQRAAGDEVWTMRYWSLLYGVIMVATAALLARRWFGRGAAVLTAFLVAISPPMWVYSQEIRAYAVMPLYALILLGLLQWYLRCAAEVGAPSGKVRRALIWLLLIEMMTLYTHNLSVPIVAWLNVSAVIGLAVQRQWRRVGQWIAIHIGMLLLYLPWLITQRPTGTPLNTPPSLSFDLLLKIWQSYFTGINQMLLPQNAETVAPLMRLIAVFGVIALVGIVLALLRRDRRVYVVASQVILIPVFESAIILAAHIDFHPRYYVAAVPATLMLIAAGINPHPLTPPLHQVERGKPALGIGSIVRWGGAVVVVGLAAAITSNMTTLLFSNIGYQHDRFVVAARRYTYLNADDAIVIPYGWEPTLDYYKKKLNIKAKVIAIPLYASFDTIAERLTTELKGVKNVELFDWYPLPADMRGVLPCLLGVDRAYSPSADLHGTVGVNSVPFEYYASSQQRVYSSTRSDVSYGGLLKLVETERISGIFGTCVITRWQLTQRTQDNFSLLVRASYMNGQEIRRHNAVMRDDKQLPTSLWQPGQTYTVVSHIWPFMGEYGDFPLTATVYSDAAPSGLDVYVNNLIVGKESQIEQAVGLAVPADVAQKYILDVIENCRSAGKPPFLFVPSIGDIRVPTSPTLQAGQRFTATSAWYNCDTQSAKQEAATLVLEGQGWRVESSYPVPPSSLFVSSHMLTVPLQATGKARLYAITPKDPEGATLASYEIQEVKRSFTAVSMPFPAEARYRNVGTLIGVDAPTEISKGTGITVKLQWKAAATATIPYTVFVHLLDSEGRVIAQSDQQPAKNARPTTSWIEGEYILDEHQLGAVSTYTGAAKLEIGLYDAKTNQRLKLENGDDHVVLPINITVK